jgi:hypothetical protein
MKRYGLISLVDEQTIDKTLELVLNGKPKSEIVFTTEVGLFDGATSRGINEYITSKGYWNYHTGIDNLRDKEVKTPFDGCALIIGNSTEVYNNLPNESQDFIFIDALHTFAAVVADFFCYSGKVKVGGFIGFHDTGKHIKPTHDWQRIGNSDDPDMCLGGVRRALERIGLLYNFYHNWRLVFDEADENDAAGGVCIFQRLK